MLSGGIPCPGEYDPPTNIQGQSFKVVEFLFLVPCTFLSMSHASKEAVLLLSQTSVDLLFTGQRQPAERATQVLFLGISRASLKDSVHGEGVICPPLDLVASWPSLSSAYKVTSWLLFLQGLLSQENRTRTLLVPAAILMEFYQVQLCACTPNSHPPAPQIRHLSHHSKDPLKEIDRNT